MEFLQKSGSHGSSSRVDIIAGCVAVASFLVLGLLFILFLKQRRSMKKKSDTEVTVWSTLPLFRGGGSTDNNSPLAEWAMSCKSKGIIDKIVDPRLTGQIEPSSLRIFMEIAEKCLKDYGGERPRMADVIWDLKYVLRLQMIHEDSTISSFGSEGLLVNLMVGGSFSSKSIVAHSFVGDSSFSPN